MLCAEDGGSPAADTDTFALLRSHYADEYPKIAALLEENWRVRRELDEGVWHDTDAGTMEVSAKMRNGAVQSAEFCGERFFGLNSGRFDVRDKENHEEGETRR